MEKYEFILKCINDKLKENADVLEMYRKESPEKDATIRELKVENAALRNEIENLKARIKEIENS